MTDRSADTADAAAATTEAVSTAARGSGCAYGFCHIEPSPVSCAAISFASCSIDCPRNHST